jgi:hypothetical protein
MGDLNVQARLVPGPRGWRWLTEGWKLFRSAPLSWLALVFGYWMLMTVVSILPLIGVVAVLVLVPGFSIAFMAASREAEQGRPVQLSLLFAGFRQNLRGQLVLGGVYFASIALLLSVSMLADDGALARWMVTGARPGTQVVQSDAFLSSLMVAATIYIPIMMLFWFAPTLVAWHGMPVGKALFFSLFACLMNWRAFTVYSIGCALVLLVAPFIVLFVLMLASGGTLRPAAMAVLFPFVLSMMPTLFASFYASYRDIFAPAPAQLEETLPQE